MRRFFRRLPSVLALLGAVLCLISCGAPLQLPPLPTTAPAAPVTPRPVAAPSALLKPLPATAPPLDGDALVIPEGTVFIDCHPEDGSGAEAFRRARAAFAAALDAREPEVITRGVSPTQDDFLAMDYGVFWLQQYWYWTGPVRLKGESEEHEITVYSFKYYDLSDEQIRAMKAEMDEATASILAEVPAGADEWTCIKCVHDALAARVTYDTSLSLPHIHDAYGALGCGQAVCDGYASAFATIMNRIGINCLVVSSDTHAWNQLSLMSDEQYLDCTWDDLDEYDAYGRPYILYNYFFLTPEELNLVEDHTITGLVPLTDSGPERVGYHAHEGLLIGAGDPGGTEWALRRQFEAGSNLLTLRFTDADAWLDAEALLEDNAYRLAEMLAEIGYKGSFMCSFNETLYTIDVYLYPPAAWVG